MTDAVPTKPSPMPADHAGQRKAVYLTLGGGLLVVAIGLLVWAFASLNDYHDRRMEAGNARVRNEKILRESYDAGKKQIAQREIEAADLIEEGAKSIMIGLFAASGGVLIIALGFLLTAFQKPKPPPLRRQSRRHRLS